MQKRRHPRVVFLEPKSTHLHVYSAVHIPRIGSLLLATLLRDRGYDVEVIVEDMLRRRVREADIWQRIREADLLCISTITSTVQRCYMWADRARAAGIPVVLGGTHVTYFPDEAMAHADYVMRGECDVTFPQFMDALESGYGLESVPGLTWHDGGAVRHNADAPLPGSEVLEANPFPDYGLVWQADVRGGVGSFAAARGCPFDCSFCSVTKFNGARLRAMSAERTLDMIEEHWRRFRPHYAFFAEDIFNLVKPRAKQIMRGLIERRIRPRIGFGAQMRHEVVKDTEFLQLMRAAGFDRAMVGFESINQASLDLCGKRQKVEEIEHAIREFHRHGIKVHGMFVAGFDTDEPQTFRDTLQFVKRLHLDSFQLMLLTPLPGSRDWVTEGYADGSRPLLTREWRNFDGHHAVQVPKLMTAYEANIMALRTMKKFYTLPRAFGRLLKGDWVEFAMRLTGYRIVRQWFRMPENRQYLEMLRQQLTPLRPSSGLQSGLATTRRRIVIAHTAASYAMREKLDRFFAELGVRVEHSRAGLGELLTHGQSRMAEVRRLLSDYLADWRLFSRDKTDLVVVPTDCGNEVDIQTTDLGGDAPLMVRLNLNGRASVLAQQCVQLAMGFTDDLMLAAEAFRRAMQEPQPVPVQVRR
jgi:radical SAM superfamily enzyme YgiQ (UPF0313 family)